MFIELVDMLRCPSLHEETWLVLAADRIDGRDVMDGTLGCPICQAEYPIIAGVARFGDASVTRSSLADENEALRLAALLDLTEARGYAVLVGDTASHAPRMRELTNVQLLLVNPPADIEMGNGLSGLTTAAPDMLPLAASSARAIALDVGATPELLNAALSVLAPGGRLLAPVGLPLRDGISELARDGRHWLAERLRTPVSSGIVRLDRRR